MPDHCPSKRILALTALAACAGVLQAFSHGEALKFDKHPYLQNVSQHSIVIMWETTLPSDSVVEYARVGTATYRRAPREEPPAWEFDAPGSVDLERVTRDEAVLVHEVRLDALDSGGEYRYRVISARAGGTETLTSAWHRFATAPSPDTGFRLGVWGDSRSDSAKHRLVAEGLRARQPDLVINVGDVVGDGTMRAQWRDEHFDPARRLLANTPSFIAIGNHEKNAAHFYELVSQPQPENFFAFSYGPARCLVLDSNRAYGPDSSQGKWLAGELERADGSWLLVFVHHPAWTEFWDDQGYTGEVRMRFYLAPLFERFGVDVVFWGHTHAYERGRKNGVTYVCTGGGGSGLDRFQNDIEHITKSVGAWHFCVADVTPTALGFIAADIEGRALDRWTLTRATSGATNFEEVTPDPGAPADSEREMPPSSPDEEY